MTRPWTCVVTCVVLTLCVLSSLITTALSPQPPPACLTVVTPPCRGSQCQLDVRCSPEKLSSACERSANALKNCSDVPRWVRTCTCMRIGLVDADSSLVDSRSATSTRSIRSRTEAQPSTRHDVLTPSTNPGFEAVSDARTLHQDQLDDLHRRTP